MKGLVHIYTGNGKGKTTAALGLCLRACGAKLRVLLVQFLKPVNAKSGELASLKKLKGINVVRFHALHPMFCKGGVNKDGKKLFGLRQELKKNLLEAEELILSSKYDVVVLDEVINCVSGGFLDTDVLKRIILNKPANIELILTGRGAPQGLIDIADYVTEMKEVKHPYKKGVKARKGVEA